MTNRIDTVASPARISLIYALFFMMAEALAAARTPYWLGWTLSDAISIAFGGVIFAIVLVLASHLLAFLIRWGGRKKIDSERLFLYLCALIAITYWAVLGATAYSTAGPLTIPLALLLLIFTATSIFFERALPRRDLSLAIAWGAALVAGLITMHVATRFFFLRHDAALIGARIALPWTGAIAVLATFYASWAKKRAFSTARTFGPIIVGASLVPLAFAVPSLLPKSSNPDRPPNIILLTADTLRADYCSTYGGKIPTPALDKLASQGTLVLQCYAVAPWTIPSLDGIFASKFPPSVTPGVSRQDQYIEVSSYRELGQYWEGPAGESIVDRLRQQGYATNAFIGNFAMFAESWLLRDFDSALVMDINLKESRGFLRIFPILEGALTSVIPALEDEHSFDYTRRLGAYTELYLRRMRHRPFFLWVHFLDPHTPYDPPERYKTMSGPFPYLGIGFSATEARNNIEYVRSLYEGEVQYVDEAVGGILENIEALGLNDSTFVAFTSDHGEELWDHDEIGHGYTLFNEQVRVPLIFAGPGIPFQTISQPVSGIDLIPTLAGLAGLPPMEGWRGRDLSPIVKGNLKDGPPEVPVFIQATGILPRPPEPLQAVVWKDHKLIRGLKTGRFELYDLVKDPLEKSDLSGAESLLAEELLSILVQWSDSFPTTFADMADRYGALEMNEVMIQGLKAMGYLD